MAYFIFVSLRQGEQDLEELYRKWERSRNIDSPAVGSLKIFHQLVQKNLTDLKPALVEQYEMEVMRYTNAMMAHSRGEGPMPHFGPIQHESPNHPPTMRRAQTPNPYILENLSVAGPSYYHGGKQPHQAPGTPRNWRSYGPLVGRPEATPVEHGRAGNLVDVSPGFVDRIIETFHP